MGGKDITQGEQLNRFLLVMLFVKLTPKQAPFVSKMILYPISDF